MSENTDFTAINNNSYDDPLFLSTSDYSGMKLLETVFNGQNYAHWSREVTNIRERYGQSNGPLLFQLKKEIRNISQDNDSVAEYFTNLKRRLDDIDEIEAFPDCDCGALEKCTCNILKKMLEAVSREKLITFMMGLNSSYENLRTNILSMDPLPNINKTYSILQQVESQKNISQILQTGQDSSALAAMKSQGVINGGNQCPQSGANQGPQIPWNVWEKDSNKRPKYNDRWCTTCNKGGHTVESCFVLHLELRAGYLARKATAQKTNPQNQRFAANAIEMQNDTPFDYADERSDMGAHPVAGSSGKGQELPKVDPALVNAIYQQVMQAISNNQDSGIHYSSASVNFAGIILATNAVSHSSCSNKIEWILDTGATNHITSQKHLFVSLNLMPKPILIGLPDGTIKLVKYSGDINLHSGIALSEVLFVPDIKYNLLSIGKISVHSGMTTLFDDTKCVVQALDKQIVAVCPKEGGLYKLKQSVLHQNISFENADVNNNISCFSSPNRSFLCSATDRCSRHNKVDLYHARLGHISIVKMSHIPEMNGLNLKDYNCETCISAKMHKLPFTRDHSRVRKPFDLIHVDLWGPYRVATITGAHYFFTIVDDNTRITWTFLLKTKEFVSTVIDNFFSQVKNQYNTSVKVVRSDNGT
ncbi:uncharacterized protein LOC141649791 [Silene latifolia]|uniref:uncharacterized protein LOC141649791 n=1 Tax=Silene latifolia TaxID=37657 RepID=UPI003D770245